MSCDYLNMYVCTAKPIQCVFQCANVLRRIIILCLKYVFSSNIISLAVVCVGWQMRSLHCVLYTLYRMCAERKPTLFKVDSAQVCTPPSIPAFTGEILLFLGCLSAGENQSALIWLCQCSWHKTCQLAGGCTIERFRPERQDL